MASVWFSVIVLLTVQQAFGNVCFDKTKILSCDDCIRCGGYWCNEPGSLRCTYSLMDDWCPNDREAAVKIPQVKTPGDLVNPSYVERTVLVGFQNSLQIVYTPSTKTKPQVKINIVSTTQNDKFDIKESFDDWKCAGSHCANIQAMATNDFCTANSTTHEYVYANVSIGGIPDQVQLKYHVPCACECSKKVEQNSKTCNFNGNLTCGVCTCESGWTGADCSIDSRPTDRPTLRPTYRPTQRPTERPRVCPDNGGRGDLPCINPQNDRECSGNGYCDECNTCVCDETKEGSRYFDKEDYCSDLCMASSECTLCLVNNTLGLCDFCMVHSMYNVYVHKYNTSHKEETDELGRKLWVKCNETMSDCLYTYVVKTDEEGDVHMMVVESCNDINADEHTADSNVAIIVPITVIGVLAITALAGVAIWKHMTALPAVPMNDPGYENIDAEDCTGENPLYKPPTSSFKNPTYGKW